MKKRVLCTVLLFVLLLQTVLLTSCAAGERLMARLGFDTHDYRGESVIRTHAADSEIAVTLAEMTRSLTVSSPILTPFSGTKEAAEVCRDAVLRHMLLENYAQYAGNTVLLEKAAAAYPQMQLTVLIPVGDFEKVVYATFGGREKITNGDGELFTYLEKADAYTTAAPISDSEVEITVLRLEETERTYRLYFSSALGEITSPTYCALIIRREDGTMYFSELTVKK